MPVGPAASSDVLVHADAGDYRPLNSVLSAVHGLARAGESVFGIRARNSALICVFLLMAKSTKE